MTKDEILNNAINDYTNSIISDPKLRFETVVNNMITQLREAETPEPDISDCINTLMELRGTSEIKILHEIPPPEKQDKPGTPDRFIKAIDIHNAVKKEGSHGTSQK